MADIYAYATQYTRQHMDGVPHPTPNMTNRKPSDSGAKRKPEWNVPNRKASARLDARRRAFDNMKDQSGYTRPGSMKPHQ